MAKTRARLAYAYHPLSPCQKNPVRYSRKDRAGNTEPRKQSGENKEARRQSGEVKFIATSICSLFSPRLKIGFADTMTLLKAQPRLSYRIFFLSCLIISYHIVSSLIYLNVSYLIPIANSTSIPSIKTDAAHFPRSCTAPTGGYERGDNNMIERGG